MSTGSRAMSEALSLQLDGKRKNGKWAYGSLTNDQNSDRSANRAWMVALANAGLVLDHAPALVLDAAGKRSNGRFEYGGVDFADSQNPSTFRPMISRCGTILDFAPALAQEVVDGHIALDAAYRKAQEARNVEQGSGNGGDRRSDQWHDRATENDKVSSRAFAELSGVGRNRVNRYLAAWARAFSQLTTNGHF